MLAAHHFCTRAFGVEPSIAWFPDTFGFARTLPSLLAHAGIKYFATTKLEWNDTSHFPYPQFRWRGPDGARSRRPTCIRSTADASRRVPPLARAASRWSWATVTAAAVRRRQVRDARPVGRWEAPAEWFARLDADRSALALHDEELYLQYHRGVYTTHHDVKAANAALERRLAQVEELAAWCVAVRAQSDALGRIRAALDEAWRIVLRNQFHDVLPGTSVAEVYVNVRSEYARANRLVDDASAAAAAMLPRGAHPPQAPAWSEPRERDGAYDFDNGLVRARVAPTARSSSRPSAMASISSSGPTV